MKNRETLIISVIAIIVSIGSVITAVTANQIAQTASQIAEKSYEIAYQTNLPIICAITTRHYDEEEGVYTEKITVNNDGFPLKEFGGYAHAIMEIGLAGNETYIPLGGYFDLPDYTGSGKGLLATIHEENNLSLYYSIRDEFVQEALKDGCQPGVWLWKILWVTYRDYAGQRWEQYFYVSTVGSMEISEGHAREILDSADRNRQLAANKGLEFYIWQPKGAELWEWYKGEIVD